MLANYGISRNPRPFVLVQTVSGEVPDHVYEGIAKICEREHIKRFSDNNFDIFDHGIVGGSFRYEIMRDGK